MVIKRVLSQSKPTPLNELEAIDDIALVAHEEEAALQGRSIRGSFICGDLGSELDAATKDTLGFGRARIGFGRG